MIPSKQAQIFTWWISKFALLQWCHNECNGVSNHWHLDCVLNHLFRRRSKKTSKLWVNGLCEGNPPVTGGFPSQRATNMEKVSIWWHHHEWHNSFKRSIPLSSIFLVIERSYNVDRPGDFKGCTHLEKCDGIGLLCLPVGLPLWRYVMQWGMWGGSPPGVGCWALAKDGLCEECTGVDHAKTWLNSAKYL